MSVSVDVALVAYRRWDLTSSCLAHLATQTHPHRVYLCDNGCDEGTAERVREHFPGVEVMRLERNMPFAVACNRAVAAGAGDVVLTLNNDVDARPDFIERLVAPLAADAGVGSVASLLLRPGEDSVDSVGFLADRTLAPFPRWQGHHPSQVRAHSPVMIGPGGSAAAFRRVAWEEIGGLDERIAAYYEDFDLIVRLRIAGWRSAEALDAIAVHIGSATNGHRSAASRLKGGFGRGYLLRRYGVLRSRVFVRALATEAIMVAGDLAVSRDTAALRGRLAGWRAGAGLPRHRLPADSHLDAGISFADSLRMRRDVVRQRPVGRY